MTRMTNRQKRLEVNRAAWDAYQADYMRFNPKDAPDFFERDLQL